MPRLGCTAAYVFAYRNTQMTLDDYTEAIESVARMEFDGLDLEILDDTHIPIYTPQRCRMLRAHARRMGVRLSGFTPWNTQKYLYSLDARRRQRGLALFEQGCRVARDLGIRRVHLGSDVPAELVATRMTEYTGAPPLRMRWDRLSWSNAWRLTVDTYRQANRVARKHGLRMGLEPRANSMIWSADSFLRLREAVGRNLTCVWDLMHAAYHREDSALAIRKLGSALGTVQLCDADGQTLYHRPLGSGILDFSAIKKALQDIRFQGPIALELYRSGKDPKAAVDRYYAASKRLWEST